MEGGKLMAVVKTRCEVCHGTGLVGGKPCEPCNGTGHRDWVPVEVPKHLAP
jgi:DnaJ-class molecular chaperone